MSSPKVIDSSYCKNTLFGANDPVSIDQQRDAVMRKDGLDTTQFAIPVFMITQCSKSAIWSAHPCHLLYAALEIFHRVRDIIPREYEKVGLERIDPVDELPYLFPWHVNAGMDIGDLYDAQRVSEGQGKLAYLKRFSAIDCPVSGKHKGCCGQSAHSNSKKVTPGRIHGAESHSAIIVKYPGNNSAKPGKTIEKQKRQC